LAAVHDVARLRLHPQITCCAVDDALWLRGANADDPLRFALRSILGVECFDVDDAGKITPSGRRIPVGRLPDGPWTPLEEWLLLALPRSSLPARAPALSPLRLVRTSRERAANVLVTDLAAWHEFATAAPQIRLQNLSFAASDDGLVVIRGLPLPPLPGRPYCETDGVAVPSGWRWSPAVEARVLRDALELADQDLALFTQEGVSEIVRGDDFVGATRSALRLTQEELSCGR
jgi:hypothetical protein